MECVVYWVYFDIFLKPAELLWDIRQVGFNIKERLQKFPNWKDFIPEKVRFNHERKNHEDVPVFGTILQHLGWFKHCVFSGCRIQDLVHQQSCQ